MTKNEEEDKTHYIDLTPSPAEHMYIMARLVDGASPRNYVSTELRRIGAIYDKCGLTWEYFNNILEAKRKEKA